MHGLKVFKSVGAALKPSPYFLCVVVEVSQLLLVVIAFLIGPGKPVPFTVLLLLAGVLGFCMMPITCRKCGYTLMSARPLWPPRKCPSCGTSTVKGLATKGPGAKL